MFRILPTEIALLGIPAREGAVFESALLELKPARFRVVRVGRDGVDLERVAWLDAPLQRPQRVDAVAEAVAGEAPSSGVRKKRAAGKRRARR